MSLQIRLRPVDDLVALRNQGCQRREARDNIVAEKPCPSVPVAGRAGSRIGKSSRRDDQFRALECLAIGASDREARQDIRHLPVGQQRHAATQHHLDDGVQHVRSPV